MAEFAKQALGLGSDKIAGGARSLIEGTYKSLCADIITGKHAPGDKLRLEKLGALYDVSVGTVREALSLLVSDGLVVPEAQRGFRVAPMSVEDFHDLARMRVMLECSALRDSMRDGNDAWEGRIVDAFHRLSLAEQRLQSDPDGEFNNWEERNRLFHEALVSGCGSIWTLRFREILYRHGERYRRLTISKRPDPGQFSHSEHEEIFRLALARDADAAVAALAAHIQSSVSFVEVGHLLPHRGAGHIDGADVHGVKPGIPKAQLRSKLV